MQLPDYPITRLSNTDMHPGDRLGPYEIQSPLGIGGMSACGRVSRKVN